MAGRGGGKTGIGPGQGGGTIDTSNQKKSYKYAISTGPSTPQPEKEVMKTTRVETITTNEELITISNLTEETTQTTQEMENEEDVLASISLTNVPKEIPKFTPNIQWTRDLMKNLPKKRYGIEIKIVPEETRIEPNKAPRYSHVRIFNAIATAILTVAPGTSICSINESKEAIMNVEDLPTTQASVNYYLESPVVNNHARIYIMCIKPLFIIMKNNSFMKWLQKNRIFVEENDLQTTLPSTVGILLFVHPRPPLFEVYQEQLRAMFVGKAVPEFKIRRFKVKAEGENAYVIMIQTVQDKAQEVSKQFEEVNDKNPYKFVMEIVDRITYFK
jgi:hypothetical protein